LLLEIAASTSRHQRAEPGNVVALSVNDNHRERKTSEVLPIFDVAVNR